MSRFSSLVALTALGPAWPMVAAAQMAPPSAALSAQASAAYTDAELWAFAKARAEIEPIQASLPTLSTSARAQANARIDDILRRNSLTRDDYDSIATVAMADAGLNARINGLRVAATPGG